MLQQTQVATVVPYFHRFLSAFPTIQALAVADEQDVLRLWEGLGYYQRARGLHQAAQRIVAEHAGIFPTDPAQLAALPGLGRYTVNAVLSQAFDARLPVLEANTQRVLSRFFGPLDDPRQGPARAWLWQAAEDLLPRRGSGEFNQALMELGALVCTSTAPHCPDCPLASRCEAFRQGLQESIPARTPKPVVTLVAEAAAVIQRDGRVLLGQRPGGGRWAGLWEFPHGPVLDGESPEDAARRLAAELAGIETAPGSEVATLRHGITRYRITLSCFELPHISGEFRSAFYTQAIWLLPADLAGYPVSSPQRRLSTLLVSPGRQRRLF